MNYICKNCGNVISAKKFQKENKLREAAESFGCLIWLIILLCFCSIILIPIALILIGSAYDKTPKFECPYCGAKDSIIPANTPMVQKIIEEYNLEEKIKQYEQEDEKDKQREEKRKKRKRTF